jgi:tetratricopeptide (TPR) repeat protein
VLNTESDFALLQLQSQVESADTADQIASLRTIGKMLIQQQRYAEALPVYESLLTLDPTGVQTQQTLARCLERLGRWDEAVARYHLVLEADPARVDALAGIGLCMLRQNSPALALDALDRCLDLNPSHLGALIGKATCLRLTGRSEEADFVYRDAIRRHPEMESALNELLSREAEPRAPVEQPQPASDSQIADLENIVAAAVSAEDYDTAAAHCRTLTELTPDWYEAWFDLGVFEQRNSNFEAAADAFRRAARLQPLSVEPLQALAQLYHVQGDMQAAEAVYESALSLAPDSPDLIWNLGLVLEQEGDFAGAAQKYSRLVKGDQDRGEAWFRLGFARLRLADHEGAVVALRRALDLGVHAFESHYNLGLAYWELGRVHQAEECFHAVLIVQPDFQPAHRGLAAVALQQGDYSQARDLHHQLAESGDASAEVLFNLAVFEHRDNRLHSAIEFYKQALKVDPDLEDASAGLALAQSTLSARRYK